MSYMQEQIAAVVRKSNETSQAWCATLESTTQSENWIQITGQQLNLYYPCPDPPESKLATIQIPQGVSVLDWESDLFVTLNYDSNQIDVTAAFLERYIENVLQDVPSDSRWTSTIEMA